MALLQCLEPCQPFIGCDFSQTSAFIPMPSAPNDDDGIVVEELSTMSGLEGLIRFRVISGDRAGRFGRVQRPVNDEEIGACLLLFESTSLRVTSA
jgi:hypothetical protein